MANPMSISAAAATSQVAKQQDAYDRIQEQNRLLRAALADLAPICWRINDTTDRSETDRYYLASTNDWDDLHAALHKHLFVIKTVED